MEKITIKIPFGLTPSEETMLIAKHLGKQLSLPKSQNLIGNGYEIVNEKTQIEVVREHREKPIIHRTCPCCNTIFEQGIGNKIFANYGGNKWSFYACSSECAETVISINPQRISTTRNGLKTMRFF